MHDHILMRGFAAVVALTVLPAHAADRPVRLQVMPDVSKDVVAMPSILAPVDMAEKKINAALPRLNENVRKAVAECTADGGANSSWERSVDATMRGPGYLSYTITDNTFCGGAHPNVGTMSIVYDLRTGSPVDWTRLLPPALTGTVALSDGADGTKMVTLASKDLFALYVANYRPRNGAAKSNTDDDDCREAITRAADDGPPAMMVWLDAKANGLALQFDLPHVVQACADAVVIPTATLRQMGAQPVLVDAIEAAHAH